MCTDLRENLRDNEDVHEVPKDDSMKPNSSAMKKIVQELLQEFIDIALKKINETKQEKPGDQERKFMFEERDMFQKFI